MSDKLKIAIGVAIGVLCAVLLFCEVVVIACSINGLTFGEQICSWFAPHKAQQTKALIGTMKTLIR